MANTPENKVLKDRVNAEVQNAHRVSKDAKKKGSSDKKGSASEAGGPGDRAAARRKKLDSARETVCYNRCAGRVCVTVL